MTSVLAIDTSCDLCSVALRTDRQQSFLISEKPRSHANEILGMISDLLNEQDLSVPDLDAIALTVGPGSFTGLRIGAAVAQGLAFAHQIPLIPFSSLHAIALQAREQYQPDKVITVMHAREDEGYFAAWELQGSQLCCRSEDAVMSVGQIADAVQALSGEWFAAGNGWNPELLSQLQSKLAGSDTTVQPRASALLAAAILRLETGETIQADEVMPVYLKEQLDYRKPGQP